MQVEGIFMGKCSQCGKPALVQIGDVALCVDCNLKFEQARQMEFIRNATFMNYLLSEMEVISGLLGLYPRIQIPRPNRCIKDL
jgi:hypothetical protein